MRILTLAETAARICRGTPAQHCIKEHIDAWNKTHDPQLFRDEPPLTGKPAVDAYLAGMAEYQAGLIGCAAPAWTERPERFLAEPFFSGFPAERFLALTETPEPMRRRNVFSGMTFAR
jgi:hypothetical protein